MNGSTPIEGSVFVFDADEKKQIKKVKTDSKGNYFLTLTEGKAFDVCFYPKDKTIGFSSVLYDNRGQEKYIRVKKNISLTKIESGKSFPLKNIYFNNNAENFADYSTGELTRLVRTLKANSDKKAIIKVYFSEYKEDPVQSIELPLSFVDMKIIKSDTLNDTIMKTVYHNDRTLIQAEGIRAFLIEKGIPSSQIKAEGIKEADKSRVEIYFE